MNTSAEVFLIQHQTLFEHFVSLLNVSILFINDPKVKICACMNAIRCPNCLFVAFLSRCDVILFFEHSASHHHSIYVVPLHD